MNRDVLKTIITLEVENNGPDNSVNAFHSPIKSCIETTWHCMQYVQCRNCMISPEAAGVRSAREEGA